MGPAIKPGQKRCPFCGGPLEWLNSEDDWTARCRNCRAQGFVPVPKSRRQETLVNTALFGIANLLMILGVILYYLRLGEVYYIPPLILGIFLMATSFVRWREVLMP